MTSRDQRWLTLSEAAAYLGVHPSTLRRWADKGEIPTTLTPGGHRRFLERELHGYLEQHGQHPAPTRDNTGHAWADFALIETRQRLVKQHQEPQWLAAFDPQRRTEKRELGRRLMTLIMQHISAPDDDQQLLIEAKSIAARYAHNCIEAGLTSAEGLQATTFFRDTMTEVALEMPHVANLDSGAQLRLLRKLNQVFNVVQISFVEYYDSFSGSSDK